MSDKNMCPHCGMDIAIRNPSGYCDHLYYPENCEICKNQGGSMNLDEIKEAVEIVDRYMIGNVQPDKKRALETLKDLATSVLNADVLKECVITNSIEEQLPYSAEKMRGYNQAIHDCTIAHTRILLEKDEEIVKLTNALSAVQMLIEEDIEEDKGFTFNRKKMIDKIEEAL